MLSIEFDIENMRETIFCFDKKLFDQPICHCLNECTNECIGELKDKIKSAINIAFPVESNESVGTLNQELNRELGLSPDTRGVSILSFPGEPEYRYQDDYVYVAFAKTLSEYATKINVDPLCKAPVFFFHVFGENVVKGAYSDKHSAHHPPYFFEDDHERRFTIPFKFIKDDFIAKYGSSTSKYSVDYIEDLSAVTLLFVIQNNLHLNKCKNCGLFFIPQNRSDEIYCNGTAPQTLEDPTKLSCKQYGTTHLWYEHLGDDTALKLCRNVYNAKQMLVRRNRDITAYADNFEEFKRESLEWKKRYKAGECTADEFIAWLEEQKARKT